MTQSDQEMARGAMQPLLDELQALRAQAVQGGGAHRREALRSAGQLNAHERIAQLVDAGSFIELGALAHSDQPGQRDRSWNDGLVLGLATVDGRHVAVEATDRSVFAGTEGHVFWRKMERFHELAAQRGLPMFNLAEGGGLRMPDSMGAEGISAMSQPLSVLTHDRKTPLLHAILGTSFGLPTWQAVSADFCVQLKGTAMAMVGPRMLEVATGEQIEDEALGGWKVHAELTGHTDAFGDTEDDCIAALKRVFSYLPSNADQLPPATAPTDDPSRPVDELLKIVPTQRNKGYDIKRVVRVLFDRVGDASSVFELKADYGRALFTGLARLNGVAVGIVASNPMRNGGALGPEECDKATEFTVLCDSFHLPIVYLHDVPGFAVGSRFEHRKLATKIMVWKQANAHASVPRISIVLRKSIGAAYGAMLGPRQGADLILAWPTAEINFTGPDVGINVVHHRELQAAADAAALRKKLLADWGDTSSAYRAAAQFYIDDVIDPRDTRRLLCRWVDTVQAQGGPRSQRRLASWPTGY